MKHIIFTSALVLATAITGLATAACPTSGQVTDVAGSYETAAVTFAALANNKSVTVAGLTLTAPNGVSFNTGAKVALAFANKLDGVAPGGNFSGALTGWNAATNAGASVTFTRIITGNVANIGTATTGSPISIATTDGATGSAATITGLLAGNTVCVGAPGNWQAQEFHNTGGNLIDFKKGPIDPIDKTASVGSWTITGTGIAARVNYTYGSTTYNDAVYDIGSGSYSFCDQSGNVTTAIYIKPGQVGC